MPSNRFFTDTFPFTVEQEIVLNEEESHHICVMRSAINDTVELINGKNELAQAHIKTIEKKKVTVHIDSVSRAKKKECEITIAVAIPKGPRLDTIFEKGTELGMDRLWLFPGDKGEKFELSRSALERGNRLMQSALKQCGRLDLPKVEIKPPIAAWKKEELSHEIYFGDTEENAPPFSSVIKRTGPILFVVGPESGFSDKEIRALKALGALGVKLHPNILRTETAPLAALIIKSL